MTTRLARYGNTVMTTSAGDVAFGSGFFVTVYRPGGVASANVTGSGGTTTVTMDDPHGFAVDDFALQGPGGAWTSAVFSKVTVVSGSDVTFNANLTVLANDPFVNLGDGDTGTTSPNYDGSDATVYSDSDGVTAITNAAITCDTSGRFEFWHHGAHQFDLFVRDSDGVAQRLERRVLHQNPQSTTKPSSPDEGFVYVEDEGAATFNTRHVSLTDEDDTIDWHQ